MTKKRLDILLVERNLADTREKAKRIIMAGLVFTEQQRLDKPGTKVEASIPLTVKGKLLPYVGRGGLKLEKALKHFSITLKDRIMMDIGSSTGGFTDCALQHGAKLCYAIDVGYNQLDWKLRNDDRVIVMERTNFRYVTPDMIGHGLPDFVTIDVSFISLRLILPVLSQLLQSDSDVIALIKPQFEAGRDQVGNKGIVRDKSIHIGVLEKIVMIAEEEGYQLFDLTYSPITGGDGNIEFLAHLGWKKDKAGIGMTNVEINNLVENAHHTFHTKDIK
ncbi:23S rRNA (cytidine1920-2'-O)/16S rRNA (cytidine1409-2'-O)-methyltransferase [Lentibacillus halodurans]|uniref:23S rRNA (Cytidine1920-2'-O)/16S rRNA (Cytidine1409-2'-O)-methyltransferase n=1 Tax=Lentibacillus halodurans TaxID=237679 RepID=A0A1I0V6J7_9BACI|nr:TlyA family RNA methyltransferase [Lentibacillus halodurans]SFA71961.1 23S rRNA (cytidine1920-2'-O)/16S rRNA (cytidine1409-2'-O)-methyltransferase [Lentibacillus halodurans]